MDVSRGGVLLSLDGDLEVGTECVVRFFVPSEQVSPQTCKGHVLRTVKQNSGFNVAVQFARSLEVLELPSPMA
jgi:hypothetical protein